MAKIPPRSSFSLYNSTNYLVRVCYNAGLLHASNVQDRVSSIHVPPIFDACAARVHGCSPSSLVPTENPSGNVACLSWAFAHISRV